MPPTTHGCASQSRASHSTAKQGLIRYSQGSKLVVYSFTYITCDFSSFPRYLPLVAPPRCIAAPSLRLLPTGKAPGHHPLASFHRPLVSSPQAIFHTFTLPLPSLHFYRRRFLTRFPRL